MKKHYVQTLGGALALSGFLTLSACSSPQPEASPTPYSRIGFENTSGWNTQVAPEGEDVQAVTAFAVSLGAEGRHFDAAQLLESKATEVKSRRNELNIRLYLAAANEYLKAGDMTGFTRTLDAAEKLADRYQRAAWDEQTRRLYQLRDRQRTTSAGRHNTFTPVSPDGDGLVFMRTAPDTSERI
ncbi:hypothetical protein [Ruficoccus sp. ZRK36]|uniref:hypothetical protein n=1 Tax=Ruficoccus sp. ZRK36 TaxID=2866311 RepID=UPI001C72B450|nr:hypothetical protein [Ruficoccus sp. ZRK36]QYY37314.1 hypothetical protein K0V07_07465 [Ruficoccus sp. ZRK36]